ncbi:MAG: carbamoyltransferase HypF [Bacteroidetes bacterium]|nr:carbamoyltransferase HypF [Bacteroidota bacterium]
MNIKCMMVVAKRNKPIVKTLQVIVTGLVQGVGFRPFIHRLASGLNLAGWVQNTNENVRIRITGEQAAIEAFLSALSADTPPAAMVEKIVTEELPTEDFVGFQIQKSNDVSEDITEISPDIAVCDACMDDTTRKGNRLDYSFVNCTNCGPRFTIIRDLPYDRDKTTMRVFPMCPECRKEYEDVRDRRFHAQPVACSHCGPHYEMSVKGEKISEEMDVILPMVSQCIANGGVMLIKGLGGMHLACDAFDEVAVKKLRDLKKRDGKPFAVMFRDIETLKTCAKVNKPEEQSLLSWQRPIVLLEMKSRANLKPLAKSINAGLSLAGVLLPYMPFHYQLFGWLKTPAIVLTSGNFSSEPILTDNREAVSQFSDSVDGILLHNRDIYNRTDDSVVRVIGGKERILRRSRGYAPAPVRTALDTNGILAFGAELTNCFCVGKGKKAFMSQHIGDLQGLETTQFYEQTITQFLQLFRVTPSLLAVDLHPDYISTKTAQRFGNLPLIAVQHHHAHIASCMAEHHLDEMVIGVAMDGTGYGDDGNSWGAEFFLCDLVRYTRMTHFENVPMPGGDLASGEPWRMAVSWLYKVYGMDFLSLELPLLKEIEPEKIALLLRMIDRNINCPLTSGAGRLFDAVASLLGLCQTATFQAEGPMLLESLVRKKCRESYPFDIKETIRFDATIRGIVDDLTRQVEPSIIASKFHNTIISVIFEAVNTLRRNEGISKVVLSGGVFQNKYLLEGTIALLEENNFNVYAHAAIPTNDGGIALGQLAVASKRRETKCV